MSFQLLFAGVLGLQQWLLTLSKGVRAEGWGSSPEAQSWRKHVAVLTRLLQPVHTAVGHMDPQDVQYQVKSKRMEAKIKMQGFIWITQPAFLHSGVLRNTRLCGCP